MHGFWVGAVSLVAMLALAGCGGPVEEEPAMPPGEVHQEIACTPEGECPGTSRCVNGLCRNCELYPRYCQLK
jgi:hypothetical protein